MKNSTNVCSNSNVNRKDVPIQENNKNNISNILPEEPMRKLKESYEGQDIPKELDSLVRKTLRLEKKKFRY